MNAKNVSIKKARSKLLSIVLLASIKSHSQDGVGGNKKQTTNTINKQI